MGKEPTTPKSPATRKIIGKSARGSFQRAGSAESVKVKTASGHKVTTTSSGAVAEARAPPVDPDELTALLDLWLTGSDCLAAAAEKRVADVAAAGRAVLASAAAVEALVRAALGRSFPGALGVLADLAKVEANRPKLVEARAVEAVVRILGDPASASRRATAAWTLGALCVDEASRARAAEAIPTLVELLRDSGDEAVKFQAAAALWKLSFASDENRVAVAVAGAVPPLIELRRRGSRELQGVAKGALCNLTPHVQSRRILADALGLETKVATKFDVDSAIVTPRPLFAH